MARTKAVNSCPVLDEQRLLRCNMELTGSVLNDPKRTLTTKSKRIEMFSVPSILI
jgi:hypothetical protein